MECQAYSQGDFLNRYFKLFLESGSHRDTYIDMSHRYFFRTLAFPNNRITKTLRGQFSDLPEDIPPESVGLLEEDDCLAGIVSLIPLILHNIFNYKDNRAQFEQTLKSHLWLTHPYPRLIQTALILSNLLYTILIQNSPDPDTLKYLFYDTLKELNSDNIEGYNQLVSLIENKEELDEDILKKCSLISNR